MPPEAYRDHIVLFTRFLHRVLRTPSDYLAIKVCQKSKTPRKGQKAAVAFGSHCLPHSAGLKHLGSCSLHRAGKATTSHYLRWARSSGKAKASQFASWGSWMLGNFRMPGNVRNQCRNSVCFHWMESDTRAGLQSDH